ncbi:MAG: hypothetical protein A2085_00340 [Gemmatimonadetes bacterium GWC2_71_10]|nr:MAG: hypothetical protein A2085_00340 [Gemmatimonadetes bacterium GWC2_71_10]
MTWKRLVYRAHAARRLRERHITRQDVRHLLATGTRRRQGSTRWLIDGALGRWPARLVLYESADTVTVITVMWTAQERHL